MIENSFQILIIMTMSIALSYFLEHRFRWARRIGSVMIIITIGIIFSNIGLIAKESPVYDISFKYIVPLSIALLLLRLSIKDLKHLKKRVLLYFFIGSFGTIVGVVVSFLAFKDLIGPDAWKLSGQLAASYIGGGENAVAVGTALNVPKNLFTAAFASDNIMTALWMMVCLSAPVGLNRFFSAKISDNKIDEAKEHSEPFTAHELLPSLFYSLTIAGLIVIVSELAADFFPYIPAILWVTTFSLIIAQTPLVKKLKVSYLLGVLLFNYFFFTLGAISSVDTVLKLGPFVFVYVATVVVVHAIIVFSIGRLIKANLSELLLASQANIGGPSTACALAEANEWPHLVLPGIMLGILGYAIANYIGFAIAFLLQ